MNDKEFLNWLADRLVHVYGESPSVDFVHKLRNISVKQEQGEPVGWPCLIAEANFSQDTVTLAMQCTDYKVSAGKHWLCTTPQSAQKPLTDEQMKKNFETWHKETYVQSLEGYGDTYKNMHVRNRWQGWLAAHGIKENT